MSRWTFLGTGFQSSSASGNFNGTVPSSLPSPAYVALAVRPSDELFVAVGYGGALATSLDGGETLTPLDYAATQTCSLFGVCYSATEDLFVAVGNDGTGGASIFTSQNGITWTQRSPPSGSDLYAVCYADGMFVAVGYSGTTLTSTNGITWSAQTNSTSQQLNGIAYSSADDVFVAVGTTGAVVTSSNGTAWTTQNSTITDTLYGVCYSATEDLFVAVGANGKIITSPDGVTWTSRTSNLGTETIRSAHYNSTLGLFMVGSSGAGVSHIGYSPNGIDWTAVLLPWTSAPYSIESLSSGRCASVCGAGPILFSDDGVAWSATPFKNVGQIIGGEGLIVVNDVFYGVGNYSTTRSSTDGITWSSYTPVTTAYLYGLTYSAAEGLFVAVGSGGAIATSPDFETWTSRTSGVSLIIQDVTYAAGLFVAVGVTGTVLSSSDGVTWNAETSNVTDTLYSIIYADGLFVAVGASGRIITSPDGVNWTTQTSNTTGTLQGIAYSSVDDLFLAVGTSTAVTSPDGVAWTSKPHAMSLVKVIYSAYYDCFISANGYIPVTSADGGDTWTARQVEVTGVNISALVCRESDGLCLGATSNVVFRSKDVVNWIHTRAQDGDLLVATIAMRGSAEVTLPSGWNLVATQQLSGNTSISSGTAIASGLMAYKVRANDEIVSTLFTRTGGDVAHITISGYRAV